MYEWCLNNPSSSNSDVEGRRSMANWSFVPCLEVLPTDEVIGGSGTADDPYLLAGY